MINKQKINEITEEKYAHIFDSASAHSLGREEYDSGNEQLYDAPLFEACRIIGKKMNIRILPPVNYGGNAFKSGSMLGDIVRTSRISIREVSVKGNWWNEDNGHLLCFMLEDERPVALIQESEKRYRLYDPTTGNKELVDENTAKRLSSRAYFFCPLLPDRKLTLKEVFILGLKHVWHKDFLMVLLICTAIGLLGTVIPIATGIIFDKVIPEGDTVGIWQIALFLLAGAAAGFMLQLAGAVALLRIEWKVDTAIETSVWDRLLNLSPSFFKQYSTGDLAARLEGASGIGSKIFGVVAPSMLSAVVSLFSYVVLFYYDVKLALAVTFLVVLWIGVSAILGKLQMNSRKEVEFRYVKLSGLTEQIIGGIMKIRGAAAEKRAFSIWANENMRLKMLSYRAGSLLNYMLTFNSVFPLVTTIIIFHLFTNYRSTSMSAGSFIAFTSTFASFLTGVIKFSELPVKLNEVLRKFEMIKPVLEEIPETCRQKKDPGLLNGAMELSRVTFKYDDSDTPALDDISLNINPAEKVAVVGTSGSGKSTLLKVMTGFEKPQNGSVFYDGYDIDKVNLAALRKQIGVVLHNGNLLDDNIFKNIAGFNCNISTADVWHAANMAAVDEDIIRLTGGVYADVFDGGKTLPDVMRLKLLIARIFAKRPRIVMFDGALAFLDKDSRAIIYKGIKDLNSTGIFVTHDMDIVSKCDRIVVMDKGRIVEQGTFEELKNSKGYFCKLFKP